MKFLKKHPINENVNNEFKNLVDKKKSEFLTGMNTFLRNIKTEAKETQEASYIIKSALEGKHISKEESKIVKQQLGDILKACGIWVPLALLPGSAVIIPFIAIFAKKLNIDIFPSAFKPQVLDNTEEIHNHVDQLIENEEFELHVIDTLSVEEINHIYEYITHKDTNPINKDTTLLDKIRYFKANLEDFKKFWNDKINLNNEIPK